MVHKETDIYIAEVRQAAPDTDDLTLIGERLSAGEIVQLESVFIIDLDAKAKVVRLGYDRAGTKFWIRRNAIGTNDYDLPLTRPIILVENEAPCGMVESPGSGEECLLVARGFYREVHKA